MKGIFGLTNGPAQNRDNKFFNKPESKYLAGLSTGPMFHPSFYIPTHQMHHNYQFGCWFQGFNGLCILKRHIWPYKRTCADFWCNRHLEKSFWRTEIMTITFSTSKNLKFLCLSNLRHLPIFDPTLYTSTHALHINYQCACWYRYLCELGTPWRVFLPFNGHVHKSLRYRFQLVKIEISLFVIFEAHNDFDSTLHTPTYASCVNYQLISINSCESHPEKEHICSYKRTFTEIATTSQNRNLAFW